MVFEIDQGNGDSDVSEMEADPLLNEIAQFLRGRAPNTGLSLSQEYE